MTGSEAVMAAECPGPSSRSWILRAFSYSKSLSGTPPGNICPYGRYSDTLIHNICQSKYAHFWRGMGS